MVTLCLLMLAIGVTVKEEPWAQPFRKVLACCREPRAPCSHRNKSFNEYFSCGVCISFFIGMHLLKSKALCMHSICDRTHNQHLTKSTFGKCENNIYPLVN